ncbi:MAG: enoyl-CoA hydratase/isomerase family protein [Xanthomonadales bacterium]|nr:enoyl-CoA hydratase/isomerase family protein [Xanthomonadales bacterium]
MANLLSELDDRGVLYLVLNRPEVHNAFDSDLVGTLTAALERAQENRDVRVIVLTGAGASFSAGADLNWMRSMVGASEQENEQDALQLARLMRTLNYHDRPTIACVNGPAFGGGVGLVACCDIAIAADDARFGLTEVTLGLAPAVISPYVERCIGERQARRYFLTGERFDAERAQALGLVHEVVAPGTLDDQRDSLLDRLLKAGPAAQRECKRLAFTVAGHDRDSQKALDQHTARVIAAMRISEEGQEGLNAFLEKRKPGWTTGE